MYLSCDLRIVFGFDYISSLGIDGISYPIYGLGADAYLELECIALDFWLLSNRVAIAFSSIVV